MSFILRIVLFLNQFVICICQTDNLFIFLSDLVLHNRLLNFTNYLHSFLITDCVIKFPKH